MRFCAAALLSCVLLAGCTGGDEVPKDFVEADLAGKIDNREWQYKYAYTNPVDRTPDEDDIMFVFLPVKPKDACPKTLASLKDSRHVRMAAPTKPQMLLIKGDSLHTVTFQFTMKNGAPFASVAKKGKIKITSVTGSEIKGKIFALRTNGLYVSGNFTAHVCNSLDFQ
jgi:hypothetical protein